MGKHVLMAVLWGFATWTWLSMAAVLLPVPDVGPVVGLIAATAIVFRGATTRPRIHQPNRHLADSSR